MNEIRGIVAPTHHPSPRGINMSAIAQTYSSTSSTPRTWFITGAASGFGRAFAEHAQAQGHNVVATARDIDRLADLVALAPERTLAVPLDVDAPGTAETAIQAAVARFGRIDVLINNAGYGVVGALEET